MGVSDVPVCEIVDCFSFVIRFVRDLNDHSLFLSINN